jgi:hypothetical protein
VCPGQTGMPTVELLLDGDDRDGQLRWCVGGSPPADRGMGVLPE